MKDWMKLNNIFDVKSGDFQHGLTQEQLASHNIYCGENTLKVVDWSVGIIAKEMSTNVQMRKTYFGILDEGEEKAPTYIALQNKEAYAEFLKLVDITEEHLPYEDYLVIVKMNFSVYLTTLFSRKWLIKNDIAITTSFQAMMITNFRKVGDWFARVVNDQLGDILKKEYPEEIKIALGEMFGPLLPSESDVNKKTVQEILEEVKKNP